MGSAWKLRRALTGAAFVAVVAVLVGVPLASSANPDIDGFELHGNAAGNGKNDWDSRGAPLVFTGPAPIRRTGPTSASTRSRRRTRGHQPVDLEQADVTPEVGHRRDYAAVCRGRQPHPLLPGRTASSTTPATRTWASGCSRTRSA